MATFLALIIYTGIISSATHVLPRSGRPIPSKSCACRLHVPVAVVNPGRLVFAGFLAAGAAAAATPAEAPAEAPASLARPPPFGLVLIMRTSCTGSNGTTTCGASPAASSRRAAFLPLVAGLAMRGFRA